VAGIASYGRDRYQEVHPCQYDSIIALLFVTANVERGSWRG